MGEGGATFINKKGGLRFGVSHAWDKAIRGVPRRLFIHDE